MAGSALGACVAWFAFSLVSSNESGESVMGFNLMRLEDERAVSFLFFALACSVAGDNLLGDLACSLAGDNLLGDWAVPFMTQGSNNAADQFE